MISVVNFFYLTFLPDDADKIFVHIFFFMNGIAGSLFMSSSWPCIKLTVFKNLTTTAFGLAYSAMNAMKFLGGAFIGLVIDYTAQASGGYLWSSILLLVAYILTTLIGFIILIWDYSDQATLYRGVAREG